MSSATATTPIPAVMSPRTRVTRAGTPGRCWSTTAIGHLPSARFPLLWTVLGPDLGLDPRRPRREVVGGLERLAPVVRRGPGLGEPDLADLAEPLLVHGAVGGDEVASVADAGRRLARHGVD